MKTVRHVARLALSPILLGLAGIPAASSQEAGSAPAKVVVVRPSPDRPPVPAPPAKPLSPLEHALDLYRRGKLDEAHLEYETLAKAGGADAAAAYAGLSRVLLKQKNVDDAESAVKQALAADPNSSPAHVALGELLFRQGKLIEAEHEFLPLAKDDTKEARAHLGLARIYFASSFYFHAKLQIDIAEKIDSDDPDIRRSWINTLSFKERLAALKGYLESGNDESDEERQHMEAALASMQDAEEQGRRSCHVVGAAKTLDTKLEMMLRDSTHLRGVGLRVQLNGAGSTLLLDTGASGIVVDRRVAEKAGIKPIASTDFHGIGDKGPVGGYIGIADSIKVGDIEFQGCHVSVVAQRSVAEGDGLIGSDVFSPFLEDIDIPNYRFRLSPLPEVPAPTADHLALQKRFPGSERFHDRYIAPEMKSYTAIYRFGHHLLMSTRVNDLEPRLFMVDTGAFSNTISPGAAREATKVRGDSNMTVKGLSGNVKNVFTADELTLTFSHYKQKALDMVAFDTKNISDSTGTEVSGMLGFAMLRMMEIKIDYRDGLVDFAYDSKRFH